MRNTCEEDLKVGKAEEIAVLPILKNYFNDHAFRLVGSDWDSNDYVGSKGTKYEIKTRDLMSDSVEAKEGLIINVAKVSHNDYIIWNLLDGIYYRDANDIMGDCEIKSYTNALRPDERENAERTKKVFYVPISKTSCIKQYETFRTPKEKNGGMKRGVCYIRLDDEN
mgnify:CR=1 FL=1|tara:strand:- start:933 stop:1433 length:501 start_codon:yes stop_codon:yes gene_type:complete